MGVSYSLFGFKTAVFRFSVLEKVVFQNSVFGFKYGRFWFSDSKDAAFRFSLKYPYSSTVLSIASMTYCSRSCCVIPKSPLSVTRYTSNSTAKEYIRYPDSVFGLRF